jgi:hypothetical protein
LFTSKGVTLREENRELLIAIERDLHLAGKE